MHYDFLNADAIDDRKLRAQVDFFYLPVVGLNNQIKVQQNQ